MMIIIIKIITWMMICSSVVVRAVIENPDEYPAGSMAIPSSRYAPGDRFLGHAAPCSS